MRSSLSCEFCRRSKIKCVNTGRAPCQKCHKSGITSCVLSRPQNRILKRSARRLERRSPRVTNETSGLSYVAPSAELPEDHADYDVTHDGSQTRVDLHIADLSTRTILHALNVFTDKFPELGILNIPWFMRDFQSRRSRESQTLLAAVLATTQCHVSRLSTSGIEPLCPREQYASYAREMLSESSFQTPKLQVAQALLVMTLYEWGSREFHRAWIYCGIATRIMQAINSLRTAPYSPDPSSAGEEDAISIALENRTLWACFIMDRMISSGTYNPPMLPLAEMEKLRAIRPLSAVEFTFGVDLTSQTNNSEQILPTAQHVHTTLLDITQSFEVIVSGFDIWALVMTFVYNDGRRAPGMCAPPNCPWVPGSPWSNTRNRLQTWRSNQHHRLHYPENSVMAHKTLGFGESFTYINLIYFLCTLMLHREYFPFMPTAESAPRGPIDHPMLQAEAPEGWWDASALEMFDAAENIAKILREASECGAELLTPFVGFCAFSAAYMNLYVFRFPQMNFGRSRRAEENLNCCLAYLEAFRGEWKLGESWMTTIKHASLLYQRATADRSRYQGKSRADFEVLHHSIHEFRVVDRSDQHIQEIEGVEQMAPSEAYRRAPETNSTSDSLDLDIPLNDLLTEVSTHAHEQGMWTHWWPSLEINLAASSENPD